ncbi:hypothetical protein Tco_1317903 [Tanacetum coccineum]
MVLLENPNGSLDNVLDNQILEISSDDSPASSMEMYLLNEEDDGDNVVVPPILSEEIRNRIDNIMCPPPLLQEIGQDQIWKKDKGTLKPKTYYEREENREMFKSINEVIKLMLAVATNMSCLVENDKGKEGRSDNFKDN